MKPYHHALSSIAPKVNSFFQKTFETVEIVSPPVADESWKKDPVMISCSHRSHTDYFMVCKILHRLGLPNLRIAAGDNLMTLPYIGSRYLRWGAFTIERFKTNNRSYILQLCNQVTDMLVDHDNILVFPEGGRSYSGRMLPLNQVVIGSAIVAQAQHPELAVRYLPCTVSYEILPELRYFGMLGQGKRLRTPDHGFFSRLAGNGLYFGADAIAFSQFLLAHRAGKKYGKVYVDMGQPLAIADLVDLEKLKNSSASHEFFAHRAAIKQVAISLHTHMRNLYRLLPVHLVSKVLVEHGNCSRNSVVSAMEPLLATLQKDGRNLQSLRDHSPADIVAQGIVQLGYMRAARQRRGRIHLLRPAIARYYAESLYPL